MCRRRSLACLHRTRKLTPRWHSQQPQRRRPFWSSRKLRVRRKCWRRGRQRRGGAGEHLWDTTGRQTACLRPSLTPPPITTTLSCVAEAAKHRRGGDRTSCTSLLKFPSRSSSRGLPGNMTPSTAGPHLPSRMSITAETDHNACATHVLNTPVHAVVPSKPGKGLLFVRTTTTCVPAEAACPTYLLH